MTNNEIGTSIEILGKTYLIKCPEAQLDSLQRAAKFLDEKMCYIRDVGNVLSIDRIAVMAALNIAHQYLNLENESTSYRQHIEEKLIELQAKVEHAFASSEQWESQSAE